MTPDRSQRRRRAGCLHAVSLEVGEFPGRQKVSTIDRYLAVHPRLLVLRLLRRRGSGSSPLSSHELGEFGEFSCGPFFSCLHDVSLSDRRICSFHDVSLSDRRICSFHDVSLLDRRICSFHDVSLSDRRTCSFDVYSAVHGRPADHRHCSVDVYSVVHGSCMNAMFTPASRRDSFEFFF